jgi:hypothetical protein
MQNIKKRKEVKKMVNKKVKIISIGLLSLLLFPSLAAAGLIANTSQPPTLPMFDPYKAHYPSNIGEILEKRNISDANLRLPKLAPNGTLINADLLKSSSNSGQETTLQDETHSAFGTYLAYQRYLGLGQPMIMGLEVMAYVQPDLTLPSGATLYAPSSRAPDPNAFEVSTIYSLNSSSIMERKVGAWDWSISNNNHFNWVQTFAWFEQNHYFGTYAGKTYYNLVLAQDQYGNYALFLYNFYTSLWDWQTASQGPRNVDGSGQVYYEYIYSGSGPLIPTDIPYIEASNQMIYHLVGYWTQYYTWDLNYQSLGLSNGNTWSDQWLTDRNIPHGWIDNNKYFYDWYVGT